jgi:hypothetical protein
MDAPFNSTSLRFRTFCHTNNDMSSPPSIDTRSGHIPDDVDTIMSRTNESRTSNIDAKLQCCCGRPECAYLENNNTLLGGIERDLETAAKLGQVRAHLQRFRISGREHSIELCLRLDLGNLIKSFAKGPWSQANEDRSSLGFFSVCCCATLDYCRICNMRRNGHSPAPDN